MSVPIEEKKYTEFFPDLDTSIPLDILKFTKENNCIGHNIKCMDIPPLSVKFTKPVPTPVFSKSSDNLSPVDRLPEYAKYKGIPVLIHEPSDDELAQRIEYDMDEQDRNWLQKFNIRLSRLKQKNCSDDMFEFIMDRLEKHWFDLIKDIPKTSRDETPFPEDVKCAVCDDGEAENSNAIVFCDGCNLAVHQDCYGIPFIPEGQWLCRKCMISPDQPISCMLCPVEGGAFKQTNTNKWAHLSCAVWIPECRIANPVFMEPIEGIENIPKGRWKLTCYICKQRGGAPIQCSNRHCFVPFHVGCAKMAKLSMQIKGQGDSASFKAYCDKHRPKDHLDAFSADFLLQRARKQLWKQSSQRKHRIHESEDEVATQNKHVVKKRKLRPIESDEEAASDKFDDNKTSIPQFSTVHPIIPVFILDKIVNECETKRFSKNSRDIIIAISKYWSLKRESRRGAALLKRLHLEPWTASTSLSKEEEEAKAKKYSSLIFVRKDLERVRMLIDMVRKRERERVRLIKVEQELLKRMFYPLDHIIRPVLRKCQELDRNGYFKFPVDTNLVTDYLDFVKTPMDYSTISAKLDNFEYVSLAEFQNDIRLIYENCTTYNAPDTVYYRAAVKLKSYFEEVLPSLIQRASEIDTQTGLYSSETAKKYQIELKNLAKAQEKLKS